MFRSGLWRHHDFMCLWAGQSVSIFGTLVGQLALQFTAVVWLDASPAQVAALVLCGIVPAFAVGLFAGVVVDRYPRKPILVATDFGRALVLVSIPAAALFGMLTLAQLYATAISLSAMSVFFGVAYRSYLPALVSRERLVEGNSKLTASESVAETGGFSIAGWLIQVLTAPGAVFVNALSFTVSGLFISRIRHVEDRPADGAVQPRLLSGLGDGFAFVLRNPVLRTTAFTNALLNFGSQMISVVFLIYLTRDIGFNAGILGMIFAVGGVGSLIGATFASRIGLLGGFGPGIFVAVLFAGLGAFFMPLATSVSIAGVAFLVANQLVTDPFWTIYNINELSLRQALTPDGMLGRMNATVRFIEFAAMIAGGITAGVLGELIGARATLFTAATIMTLASVFIALSPILRLSRPPVAIAEVDAGLATQAPS
jgi:MFS family permease